MSASGEQNPNREELLALYELSIEEYRFEINLGWDRQKVFLAINPTLLGLIGALASREPSALGYWLVRGALIAAFAVSVLGMFIVSKSHTYYGNAKRHFMTLEARLEVPVELRLQTTDGMKETNLVSPSQRKLKVVQAVLLVLGIFAVLDVVLLIVSFAT